MSRGDRFRLKHEIQSVLTEDRQWDHRRVNLLFREFGLEPLDGDWGEAITDRLSTLTEADLIELYSIVTGVDVDEVTEAVESGDNPGGWKASYVRLFISHSAEHKAFVADVADELAVVGIHGFVAHDTMEIAAPWQAQIEAALRSMDAFVAMVHPGFSEKPWCQQEVGWAFGRRVPRLAIRVGEDPKAFLSRDQWPSGFGRSAEDVAREISGWISHVPELGEKVTHGLLKALESSRNYCQRSVGPARWRPVVLPVRGQQNCPAVAGSSAHGVIGRGA